MKSNRRTFVKKIGVGAAGLGLSSSPLAISSCAKSEVKKDDQVLFIGDNIAVADTAYGKVRGYLLRDIFYFLGIPYGADTSGENRFMPPQKPKPWTDVYNAIWWCNSAPQKMENKYANKFMSFRDHWNYDDVSEDCLRLNVFTPALNDGKKRAVLLWIHGGAMTSGNGIEQDGYNGENLARFGEVVFCSVNHRLGPLGFSDFSAVGGDKYSSSGNVGMLDLIAALEWIRDNIANFGGDPANVTIMGQSGGGKKVCATICMPSSKGLVSKAVVLSGVDIKIGEQEPAQKLGNYILREAGLDSSEIDNLQQIPWQEYFELVQKAVSKMVYETGISFSFEAHVDGHHIPQHPFYPDVSPVAADIPMIICSVTNEDSPGFLDSAFENITIVKVIDKLTKKGRGRILSGLSKENAEEIVNAYMLAFPESKPIDIWAMVESHRQRTVAVADVKLKQGPPVYTAWFGWHPPLFDNRMKAFHTADICFWLYNTDLMLSHTGGGKLPRSLSEKVAGYLVEFMKKGDPNRDGLPQWPRYTSEKGEVMMLNDICEAKNDPDREARKTMPSYI